MARCRSAELFQKRAGCDHPGRAVRRLDKITTIPGDDQVSSTDISHDQIDDVIRIADGSACKIVKRHRNLYGGVRILPGPPDIRRCQVLPKQQRCSRSPPACHAAPRVTARTSRTMLSANVAISSSERPCSSTGRGVRSSNPWSRATAFFRLSRCLSASLGVFRAETGDITAPPHPQLYISRVRQKDKVKHVSPTATIEHPRPPPTPHCTAAPQRR